MGAVTAGLLPRLAAVRTRRYRTAAHVCHEVHQPEAFLLHRLDARCGCRKAVGHGIGPVARLGGCAGEPCCHVAHGGRGSGECGNELREHGIEARSEEHTSELQSLMRISYAVFCLKKKK